MRNRPYKVRVLLRKGGIGDIKKVVQVYANNKQMAERLVAFHLAKTTDWSEGELRRAIMVPEKMQQDLLDWETIEMDEAIAKYWF